MSVSVDSLRPHPLNEKVYPASEEEDKELEDSIRENGVLEKLVAMPDGTLISGARRWRIAKKLGITHVDCEFRNFEDPEQAVIEYNKYRKKTPRIIANELNFIKQRLGGKEKKVAQLKQFQDPRFPNFEKTEEPIRADKEAAEILGVSSGKLYEIYYIYSHEDVAKPFVEKLDREEISVHCAFEEVRKAVEPQPEKPLEFWKCHACMEEYGETVTSTTFKLCPECTLDFSFWKAERGRENGG